MQPDYSLLMREIDNYKKLAREANDQRMRIEDEIYSVEQKIVQIEIDTKKSKDEILKRLMSDPVTTSPPRGPTSASTHHSSKPSSSNFAKPPTPKPPVDKTRLSSSSAQNLIRDSLKVLPGFTELVKDSELLDAFRVSYVRDLQEYYRMNTSTLHKEIYRSEAASESNGSSVRIEFNHKEQISRRPAHNNTIKETVKEEDEPSPSAQGDLEFESHERPFSNTLNGNIDKLDSGSRRNDDFTNNRGSKTLKDPKVEGKTSQNQLFAQTLGSKNVNQPSPQGNQVGQELTTQHTFDARRTLANQAYGTSNISDRPLDAQTVDRTQEADTIYSRATPTSTSQQPVSGNTTQGNRWRNDNREMNKTDQTNKTPKTVSLKEEDFATNFGNNASDSEDKSILPGNTPVKNPQELQRPSAAFPEAKTTSTKKEDVITFRHNSRDGKRYPSATTMPDNLYATLQADKVKGERPSAPQKTTHYQDSCFDRQELMTTNRYAAVVDEDEDIDMNTSSQQRESDRSNNYPRTTNESQGLQAAPREIVFKDHENSNRLGSRENSKVERDSLANPNNQESSRDRPDSSSLDYSNTKKLTDENFNKPSQTGSRRYRITNTSSDKYKIRGSKDDSRDTLNLTKPPIPDNYAHQNNNPSLKSPVIRNSNDQNNFNASTSNPFGTNIYNMPSANNFDSPTPANIFDRKSPPALNPQQEIEKNFGFDTSDISLIKKTSNQNKQESSSSGLQNPPRSEPQSRQMGSGSPSSNLRELGGLSTIPSNAVSTRPSNLPGTTPPLLANATPANIDILAVDKAFEQRNKDMIQRFDDFFKKMQIEDQIKFKGQAEHCEMPKLEASSNDHGYHHGTSVNEATHTFVADDSRMAFFKDSNINYDEYLQRKQEKEKKTGGQAANLPKGGSHHFSQVSDKNTSLKDSNKEAPIKQSSGVPTQGHPPKSHHLVRPGEGSIQEKERLMGSRGRIVDSEVALETLGAEAKYESDVQHSNYPRTIKNSSAKQSRHTGSSSRGNMGYQVSEPIIDDGDYIEEGEEKWENISAEDDEEEFAEDDLACDFDDFTPSSHRKNIEKSSSSQAGIPQKIGKPKVQNKFDDSLIQSQQDRNRTQNQESKDSSKYNKNRFSNDNMSHDQRSEENDEVFIDEKLISPKGHPNALNIPGERSTVSTNQQPPSRRVMSGKTELSQLEEEEISLSMGTRNPKEIFKNKLISKTTQNRYQ